METSPKSVEWPALDNVKGGIKAGEIAIIGAGTGKPVPVVTLQDVFDAIRDTKGGQNLIDIANMVINSGLMTEERFLEIFREELENL